MKKTITFKGVEFDVEYDYHPGEKEIRYDSNNTGSDGYDAYLEIIGISVFGENWADILEPYIEEIEEVLCRALKNDY